MKSFTISLLLGLMTFAMYAQSPQAIKYQAVVRDDAGDYIQDQIVSLRISIHEDAADGTIVYQEIFSVLTNEFGLATIEIGNGTPVVGTFPGINWGSDDYFIETELDPDGGSTYTSMGTSQMLSVAYALHAETSGDSFWENTGNDLYSSVPGNVGIGISSPDKKLSLHGTFPSNNTVEDILEIARGTLGTANVGIGAGLIFRNEEITGAYETSGRISSIMEGIAGPVSTAGMLFETKNMAGMSESLYLDPDGNVGIGTTNPSSKLHTIGGVRHEYPLSSGNALDASGATNDAFYNIINTRDGNGIGLSAGMNSFSAGSESYGVYGFNLGDGYGVFGINRFDNYGFLGSKYFGVYGESLAGNFGFIGGTNDIASGGYGVYGENGTGTYGYLGGHFSGAYAAHSLGNYAELGTLQYGAFAVHTNGNHAMLGTAHYGVSAEIATTEPGDYAIRGYGVVDVGADGTGYAYGETIGSVLGHNWLGNPYSFSVAGYSNLDYNRSGSTFGSNYYAGDFGCLAYQSSGGAEYGGYFTTWYDGGYGKESEVHINNGIGVWGDLFGADIHGKVYGTYTEGENFALFSNGDNYTNGLDVHLQKDNNGENEVLYTSVSTDATIQTSGYASLQDGESDIVFDKAFATLVSSESPIIVTVTPIGNSNGVHLADVSRTGFKVVENNGGKSNVTLNYMAIGKRSGYENPQLPEEVINANFTDKLALGLHNDGDTETDGKGLYYENGNLNVGIHPSTLPDPNRVAPNPEEIERPNRPIKPKLENMPGHRKAENMMPDNKTYQGGSENK